MTNTQLKLFVKIADNGSFTKAGLELNMTQPAVSRAISSLEAELDVHLFQRERSGVALTDVGRRLLVVFREILQGFEKADQIVASEKGLEVGTIRVGAFPVAMAHFVPRIVGDITRRYPRLRFELHEGSIDEVKEWLDARAIDVGLLIPPDGDWDTVPLWREKLYAVLRCDDPLCASGVVPVALLGGTSMITCKAGYEPPIVELFERAGADLNVRYVVQSVSTALGMVKEGLGSAILSELAIADGLPPGVAWRELEPAAYREIRMAVPRLKEASNAVKLFLRTALALFPDGLLPERVRLSLAADRR